MSTDLTKTWKTRHNYSHIKIIMNHYKTTFTLAKEYPISFPTTMKTYITSTIVPLRATRWVWTMKICSLGHLMWTHSYLIIVIRNIIFQIFKPIILPASSKSAYPTTNNHKDFSRTASPKLLFLHKNLNTLTTTASLTTLTPKLTLLRPLPYIKTLIL